MNLVEFCIRRPAFTIVLSLMLTVIGLIGYQRLPVRWIPDVSPPLVSIYTNYPGANANVVESQITTPIEAALAGVTGIDSITSSSKQGSSNIRINFKLGININHAVEDIRSALQSTIDSLPTGAKQPNVQKADANSNPILFLAFSDVRRSAKEMSDYVKQFILPRMQTVDGVSAVMTFGERLPAMRIWLDPSKMAASNVTVDDINKVLREQNVQIPSGQIKSEARYYSVVADETLNSADEFNNLIVSHEQNQAVRLKDIGQAVVDAANSETAFRVRGQPAIAIGIIPQSTANPLDVSRNVLKEFHAIQKNLPTGMQGSVVFNQATFIESSVHNVYESLFEAVVLVLLVIFLFLANWRAALIPIVTIPVCLIGTCAVMYVLGFSINTVTLMAFVLAIGLVVDDAIVMLENVMRYIESGVKPFVAAIKGGREIVFPIIAMTLTLAAVYAPIAATSGILNAVFKEFALTLAFTVIISGFVALTLTPMMCSRMLNSHKMNSFQVWLTSQLHQLQERYRIILKKIFAHRQYVLIGLGVIGIAGFMIFKILPSELAPSEDMDEVDAYIAAPRNASFQYTDSYVRQLEKAYETIPEITSYLAQVGGWAPNRSYQFISLVPRDKRNKSADAIALELNAKFKNIAGVNINVAAPPSPLAWSTGDDGSSVEMQVMSSIEYKELHAVMQRLIAALRTSSIFSYVDSRLKWDGEQFEIKIDREKMASMHVSMQDITNTISTLLAGSTIGYFQYGGNQYDVIVQINQASLADPNIISHLYVRSQDSKIVPLSEMVSMRETTSPEVLPHSERLRSDNLMARLSPSHTIADAVEEIQRIAKNILPDNVKYEFMGEARNFLESSGKMGVTFLLALIFIYLILVAQFESFIDPFVILLSVPFAIIGALLTLKLANGTLNIYSEIGLVTLIGLIAKHGILITEFANRERQNGKDIQEAVINAAVLRLRPILMTTAAMILGALPLALAAGSGSETRHQIGFVVVGGLLLGTFFSLVVVPVAYTYFAKFKKINNLEIN